MPLPKHVPLRISSSHHLIITSSHHHIISSLLHYYILVVPLPKHVPLRISSLHLYIIMNDIKPITLSYSYLSMCHCAFHHYICVSSWMISSHQYILTSNVLHHHMIISNMCHCAFHHYICISLWMISNYHYIRTSNLSYDYIQHAPLRMCGLGLIVISLYSYIKLIISLYA